MLNFNPDPLVARAVPDLSSPDPLQSEDPPQHTFIDYTTLTYTPS